ncbi:hypothetical protein SADO_13108 [Salinisphaera dokdonensis CL-ES53]|uniref:Secreted protein n=2 Tax=Salinisphaera TaxID=180541 RepID=A0ABV2B3H0_9GAMM
MIDARKTFGPFSKFAHRLALVLVASVFTLAAHADETAGADDFSQANRLLFMTDHMSNVETPAVLKYSFTRQGDKNDSFDDHVDLDVAKGEHVGKSVKVDFLSGDRHRHAPDVGNARGNPVIMMFLQNDVLSLAERTGGSWRYFQRRMKFAFEDEATVEEGKAEYDGHEVAVKRISLQPFKQEKAHREALGSETEKRYVITLSDEVPGGVLEMRSEIPPQNGASNKTVERLALKSAQRVGAESATGS